MASPTRAELFCDTVTSVLWEPAEVIFGSQGRAVSEVSEDTSMKRRLQCRNIPHRSAASTNYPHRPNGLFVADGKHAF